MSELSSDAKETLQVASADIIYLPRIVQSFGWLLVICIAYLFGSMAYGIYLGVIEGFNAAHAGNTSIDRDAISAAVQLAMGSPGGLAGIYLFQFLFVMPVIYWASNFPAQPWRKTLAIKTFSLSFLKSFILLLVIFLVLEMLLAGLFDLESGQFISMVQGSRHFGLALVISLLAPIMEETLFRGYMFKAWRNTRLGFSGTLLLTSLLFTLLHFGQYAWPILAMLFVFSLILGFAREKSGSLLLPIVLHSINNLLSVITIIYLGMDF